MNIRLSDVIIVGKDRVGALIGGGQYVHINNSYSTGKISGDDYVGGLVGYTLFGNIDNSYSKGSVVGNRKVGGLVGYWQSNTGGINNSYFIGNVSGNDQVGGLLGYSMAVYIDNSYAKANINGTDEAGGLIGRSYSDIDNSFAVANVYGTTQQGGLVARYSSGTITNTYWLNTSSNINNSFGFSSTTGVYTNDTLSYFYNCSNPPLSSWDTTDIWECTGNSFPQLVWQNPSISSSGTSSGSNIFPFMSLSSIMIVITLIVTYIIS